jgi:hypothetical protein
MRPAASAWAAAGIAHQQSKCPWHGSIVSKAKHAQAFVKNEENFHYEEKVIFLVLCYAFATLYMV